MEIDCGGEKHCIGTLWLPLKFRKTRRALLYVISGFYTLFALAFCSVSGKFSRSITVNTWNLNLNIKVTLSFKLPRS